MAFEVKSLSDIVRTTENAFSVKFFGTEQAGLLRKSVIKVLADVVGGALYMFSLIAKHIWKNRFVSTCDDDCLDGFGAEYGLPHLPPLYASGFVDVVLVDGTESVTISQGEVLVDLVSGLEYEVAVDTVLTASGNVPVIALSYGSEYNVNSGVEMQFRDGTPEGVEDVATVSSEGVSGGYATEVVVDGVAQKWGESADEYRRRLLDRVQNPPNGCSVGDLVRWCRQFSFVTKVFVKENHPTSNAVVLGLANYNSNDVSLTENQLEEVSRYVTADVRRMVCADIRVVNTHKAVYKIKAAISPYNASAKSSAENAIVAYLRNMEIGKSKTFDQLEMHVASNSSISSINISQVKKNNVVVTNFLISYYPAAGSDEAFVEGPVVEFEWDNGES